MSKKKKKLDNRKIISAVLVILVIAAGVIFGKGQLGADPDISQTLATNAPAESTTQWENDSDYTLPGTNEDDTQPDETSPVIEVSTETSYDYYLTFYSDKLLNQHYEKHGKDMGFDSPEEYEKAANEVIFNEETLHKTEKEDGDDVYYLEDTNEFVIVSTDGYIRTYFLPDDGIKYFNRQ